MHLYTMYALHAKGVFMRTKTIKVDETEKASSIRVSNKTREMLVALSRGKESQEDVILRLIKLSNNLSAKEGTQIKEKGNIIGMKYAQKNKTLDIVLKGKKYSAVCTFNDLSLMSIMRSRQLQNMRAREQDMEWELDLDLVNINKGSGWIKPSALNIEDARLIYLICVKQVLEETFDIKLYELMTEKDYLDISKWTESYDKNGLSRDSLNADVRNAFRSDLREKLR
jgi:hypothetical protein